MVGEKRTAAQEIFQYKRSGYKEQNLKERLPDMSEEEQLALLATNGMLVKRPLVIGEDFVLIGFKEAEWERLK